MKSTLQRFVLVTAMSLAAGLWTVDAHAVDNGHTNIVFMSDTDEVHLTATALLNLGRSMAEAVVESTSGPAPIAHYNFQDGDLYDDERGNYPLTEYDTTKSPGDGGISLQDGYAKLTGLGYLESSGPATTSSGFTVSYWWRCADLAAEGNFEGPSFATDTGGQDDCQLTVLGSNLDFRDTAMVFTTAKSNYPDGTWYHTVIRSEAGSNKVTVWISTEGGTLNLVANDVSGHEADLALKSFTFGTNRNKDGFGTYDLGEARIWDVAVDLSTIQTVFELGHLGVRDPQDNDPPVAYDQTLSVGTNGTVDVTLVATDWENAPLTYSIVDPPTNGTLSGEAPDLTYTPSGGLFEYDAFTFTAYDGEAYSNTGTVTVVRVPSTAADLWSIHHHAIRNDPLNTEWLASWTDGNITLHQVRYDLGTLTGTQNSASPKIAAYYALPTGGSNLPGVVQIHGGGQRANADLAKYWAQRGYAAISINWGGLPLEPGVANTDWDGLPAGFVRDGVTDAVHHNWSDPDTYADGATLYDIPHPLDSSWILYAYAARRALTFLSAQPNVNSNRLGVTGHSMGGVITILTATDPRVTCVTPSVGGCGFLYEDWWGLPGTARSTNGVEDLDLHLRTVDPRNYWPDIACPTLFLEASNDFNAPFDLVTRAMALQSTNVPQVLAFAPHFNHRFDTAAYASRVLWQKAHLTGTFGFPKTSRGELDLAQTDGIPRFKVWPDESTAHAIVGVDIYYGLTRDSRMRFWRDAQAVETNGHWEAACPVYDLDEMFVALAVVTYDCGFDLPMPAGYTSPTRYFSVASEVRTVYPPDLANNGVRWTEEKERLIDDFARGYHDWYRLNAGNSQHWQHWTRKVRDPSWRGPAGGELAVDVLTATAGNRLGVKLIAEQWNETAANTYTAVALLPAAGANSLSFPVDAFTNDLGEALTTWEEVNQLGLMPGNKIQGGLPAWSGAVPTFSNLRWEGGVYLFTNGVTSTWLEQHELRLNDGAALEDPDLDGLLNWEELVAGTDPTNNASSLLITAMDSVGSQRTLSWQAVSGKTYTVWFTTSLTESVWLELDSAIPGVEPAFTCTVAIDSATGFLRIEAEP